MTLRVEALDMDAVLGVLHPAIQRDEFFLWKPNDRDNFYVDVSEKRTERIADQLRPFGFTGRFFYGVTKIAFEHVGGFVMKVPIIEEYLPFIDAELETIRNIPEKYRSHFAETYLLPGSLGVVIQEWTPCDRRQYDQREHEIQKVADALNLYDVRWANVGFRDDGSFAIFDVQDKNAIHLIKGSKPRKASVRSRAADRRAGLCVVMVARERQVTYTQPTWRRRCTD
jgi:hypothetical protein